MRLVNCTPHKIVLMPGAVTTYDPISRKYFLVRAEDKLILHPSGNVPRCVRREEEIDSIGTIPVYRMSYRYTEGIPAPQDGVGYIVSLQTAQACPYRHDLLVPTHVVHDKRTGSIVGCLALARI